MYNDDEDPSWQDMYARERAGRERLLKEHLATRDELDRLRGLDNELRVVETENEALKAQVYDLRNGDPGPHNHCTDCGRAMVWDYYGHAWMCPRCVLAQVDKLRKQAADARHDHERAMKRADRYKQRCDAMGRALGRIFALATETPGMAWGTFIADIARRGILFGDVRVDFDPSSMPPWPEESR